MHAYQINLIRISYCKADRYISLRVQRPADRVKLTGVRQRFKQ
jgi:hypothetical protein